MIRETDGRKRWKAWRRLVGVAHAYVRSHTDGKFRCPDEPLLELSDAVQHAEKAKIDATAEAKGR